MYTRLAAVIATGLTLLGAALIVRAVAGTAGLSFAGYVSEAGVGAQAATYRLGVFGLGAALLLLSVPFATSLPLAAVLVGTGGLFAGLSGSVACTARCPLPPYERTTGADLVHGGASILAVGTIALAMIAVALAPAADAVLRRVSRVAVYVVVPLIAADGFAMLGLGRGLLTGVLERAVLTLATAWTLAVAVRHALPAPPFRGFRD